VTHVTRVLVAYSSKTQSTAEIAQTIADELRRGGLEATVADVDTRPDVGKFDAVVLGSALYFFRWRGNAVRFARRNGAALSSRPVWLFSSGPFDRSAEERDIPPVRNAQRTFERLRARGHKTFGGRAMVPSIREGLTREGKETDFRNFRQVRQWAAEVADTLRTVEGAPSLEGGAQAAPRGASRSVPTKGL
jgi:menaquinone-dependent protoporphyrinogen oxidase